MGNNSTKCIYCDEPINKSDKTCRKCNKSNVNYIDYNLDIESSKDYLKMKNSFLKENLPSTIYDFLKDKLNDEMHQTIFSNAQSWYRMPHAMIYGVKPRPVSLDNVKPWLLKIYIRYYNVHRLGLMPPGTTRINPDPGFQNFKNRMNLIMKDFDIDNELDKQT